MQSRKLRIIQLILVILFLPGISFAQQTLDEIDAKLQSKGWEWTYKKTGTRHEDSYPTHLVYFTIDGHPEYRFNTDNALVNDM